MLEDALKMRKDDQIGQEWNNNLKTKESKTFLKGM